MTENAAPPAVEIADHVAHVFVRNLDLDVDDRFQKGGATFLKSLLETHGTCYLEGHFG